MPSYRTRRRLSLLVLLVGLPLWIVVAVSGANWLEARFGRFPIWGELLLYVGLGLVWIVPLKQVFTGIGKEDPDADRQP